MIYRAVYHSPLGEMYMVSDGKKLMALDFVEVVPERPLGEQAEKLDASLPVFATVRWDIIPLPSLCPVIAWWEVMAVLLVMRAACGAKNICWS